MKTTLRLSTYSILSIVALSGCASSGKDGLSYITALAPEPAGANCLSGGIKVDAGPDTNLNHKLDTGEINSTQYACNGEDGKAGAMGAMGAMGAVGAGGQMGAAGTNGVATLVTLTAELAGPTNCVAGGTRVDSGADVNANNILDGGEITQTRYVCNGDPVAANGSNPAVAAFTPTVTTVASATTATIQQASITVPRAGKIVAIAAQDVYCASPAASLGYDCGGGNNDGSLTISASNTAAANSGAYDYIFLTSNRTESVTRTDVFSVAAAGTYTYYVRASSEDGQKGFWRKALTLLFIPN